MLRLLDSLCEQHHVATSWLTACVSRPYYQASSDWGSSEIASHHQTGLHARVVLRHTRVADRVVTHPRVPNPCNSLFCNARIN
ncbi:hypothetical protein F383_31242 [Gossypium arboreum]|uniref:Uncharacterized protein n=1 Tax=Gossypium arboreum TaxID=29729 RepID=A0A0B0PL42_GOSAR|nr:hypothetical protein F383_31242 [Gossypium arboreum]